MKGTKLMTCTPTCSLSTETNTWSVVTTMGPTPSPRREHTLSTVGLDLVLVGGCGADGAVLGDVNILDCESMRWTALQDPLPARSGHSAVVFGWRVVIFAGYGGGYKNDLFEINMCESYTHLYRYRDLPCHPDD